MSESNYEQCYYCGSTLKSNSNKEIALLFLISSIATLGLIKFKIKPTPIKLSKETQTDQMNSEFTIVG